LRFTKDSLMIHLTNTILAFLLRLTPSDQDQRVNPKTNLSWMHLMKVSWLANQDRARNSQNPTSTLHSAQKLFTSRLLLKKRLETLVHLEQKHFWPSRLLIPSRLRLQPLIHYLTIRHSTQQESSLLKIMSDIHWSATLILPPISSLFPLSLTQTRRSIKTCMSKVMKTL